MLDEEILGIDLGRTWIKAAVVNVHNGDLATERLNDPAPRPFTPESTAASVRKAVMKFDWRGKVGIAFPGVVKDGVILTADNIDQSWIRTIAGLAFKIGGSSPSAVLNDADAAGEAEMRFGAGTGQRGVVIVVTLGTGIGFSLFNNGALVPNLELGDLIHLVSDTLPERSGPQGMAHERWRAPLNDFFTLLEKLIYPDLFIVGGGVVEHAPHMLRHLKTNVRLVPATLGNNAGIIGAAVAAVSHHQLG